MDHRGQPPITGNATVVVADDDVLVVGRRLMNGGHLDNDETRSAAGSCLVVGDQLVTNHSRLSQVGLMTGGENSIS